MDKQQHIHELIDQYLTGELMGQELDKFKIRLKEDPAFLQQVQVQKAIISSIETSRKAELKAMLVASKSKKRGLIIPFGNKSLAIAASILSLLAFGLIIKTMLPNGIGELSKSEKPEATKEVVVDTNQDSNSTEDEVAQSEADVESDSAEISQPPVIALVEDTEETTMDNNDVMFEEDAELDLSELKKDEDEIDGSDFKAKRDSLLGSKNVTLWVVAYEVQVDRSADATQVTEAKKDGFFSKKNKNKEVEDKAVTQGNTEVKTLTQSQGASIRVEFWESIVKFKGYKFDGQTLLLFDTPVSSPVVLKSYNGNTYLNKNGVYYKLIANSSFNQMSRVVDTSLLQILNSK